MAISARPTQDFVPIKEVRGGTIVLKDGGLRAVIAVSSVNLALKSADEQLATINQFRSFLNSLSFPIQIVTQSRRLDIRPYLLMLDGKMKDQREPLLRLQTAGYISFIREFTEQVAIMRKHFYVVVPYNNYGITKSGGFFSSKAKGKEIEKANFEERQTQLDERVNVVIGGLEGCGVRTERLKTEEIIELFYKTFNPGDAQPAIHMETLGQ